MPHCQYPQLPLDSDLDEPLPVLGENRFPPAVGTSGKGRSAPCDLEEVTPDWRVASQRKQR